MSRRVRRMQGYFIKDTRGWTSCAAVWAYRS